MFIPSKSLSVPILEVVPHSIFLDVGEVFGRRRRVLCSTSCPLSSAASYIVVFHLCVIVIFNIAIPSVLSVATASGWCLSSPNSDFGSGNLWNSGLRLRSPRSSPIYVLYSLPEASMKTSLFEDNLQWAHVLTPQTHRNSTAPDELVTVNRVFPLSYPRVMWLALDRGYIKSHSASLDDPFNPSQFQKCHLPSRMFGLLKKSKQQQDKQRNQRKRQNRFDDDEKWVRSGDRPFTKAKRSNRDVFDQNEPQTYVSLEKMLYKAIHAIRQLKKKRNTNTSPAPKQQNLRTNFFEEGGNDVPLGSAPGKTNMHGLIMGSNLRTNFFEEGGNDVPLGSAPGKTNMHGLIMGSSKDICSLFDIYLPNLEASTHEITWRMFSTQLRNSSNKNQIKWSSDERVMQFTKPVIFSSREYGPYGSSSPRLDPYHHGPERPE
ncbi:hypothetical protein F2Q69_00029865 [Brassica cretica]|uniref:Uncharacterized protein n=1 Tax=Brassica cretica TaxID=69181 RepID=A0A8S9RTU4_BRACR|nr:hypothetical protein F2Q69_00029865 [Brassica cretica]